ncbi:conjugal transfer protein [Actinomadura xylanilytica]|uniref:conjugal transfer protein n=1 Tax=Actinomadura xylanilytica TaxID=887459 RepID=UPI00255AE59C|nr:conjugal transfer protein [Actinomadura xylanilytica]MDL4772239.1 conjugal transfer protein [Actinomadura xylanilytica]
MGHGRGTAVAEEAPAPGRALGSAVDPWEPPEQTGRRGRSGGGKGGGGRWGGSGGRWWVWVGRAVLWALILVILVNGIRAPFERFTAADKAPSGPARPGKSAQFPSSAAGAFALQFANVYLNYDQKSAPARAEQLRSFLPDGADEQFGWNRVGQLQMQSVQVAGVDARDANNATVTLLARNADKWFRLAVPVYAKNGSLVISGRPALLPPPTKAALPQGGVRDRDTALEGELQPFLGTFFQAYAHGDQTVLSRFSDGTAIGGLADSVTFVKVSEVIAPKGAVGERTVTATVAWQVPGSAAAGNGGELGQTYQLEMVKKGATWYVRDIRGSTEPSAS